MMTRNTLGMTALAGVLVAPMLAFGQAANNSTAAPGTAPTTQMNRAPDGTPGNPPGTAAERALDRAAGTNTSGAFPQNRDGGPNNPPGTAAERALDRAAGTNTSGAFPQNRDGGPNNPPGTAAGRAVDRATDGTASTAPTAGGAATQGTRPGMAQHSQTGSSAMGQPGSSTTAQPGMGAATTTDRMGNSAMTDGRANVATAGAGMGGIFAERQRMSQIIGSRVYNDRNEAIGEVDDVVLTGNQPMAIVSVGGFLGLGARLVAVPMTDLQWNQERERIMLPGATKEQLQNRPAFEYSSLRRS